MGSSATKYCIKNAAFKLSIPSYNYSKENRRASPLALPSSPGRTFIIEVFKYEKRLYSHRSH
jgi:hypothetical protein